MITEEGQGGGHSLLLLSVVCSNNRAHQKTGLIITKYLFIRRSFGLRVRNLRGKFYIGNIGFIIIGCSVFYLNMRPDYFHIFPIQVFPGSQLMSYPPRLI